MPSLSLEISETLASDLEALARRRGTSKAALVREALQAFLRREPAPPPGSALALAGDLVGCGEGPGDLSSNRTNLDDFGRS